MKIKILHEDSYGGEFLKNVIIRLKKEGLVKGKKTVEPAHIPALCDMKLDRILRAVNSTCDKIIIVMDADRPQDRSDKYEKINAHVPADMATPVKIVLMDYEIEEWICLSQDLKWHSKPSEELKKYGYTKSSLPKYADRLDIDKLIKKKCSSFLSFVDALQP